MSQVERQKRRSLRATDAFLNFLFSEFEPLEIELLKSDLRTAVGHVDMAMLMKSEGGQAAMDADQALNELRKSMDAHTARHSVRPYMDGAKYDEAENALRWTVNKDATTQGLTTTLGLVPKALENPAYNIFPVVTPWYSSIPRRTVGGTGLLYKVITAIDTDKNLGFVAEGNIVTNSPSGRADTLKMTEVDGTVVFKTLGVDNGITLQARYGGRSSIDGADFRPDEVARIALIYAFAMRCERAMLFGNITALGFAAMGTPAKGTLTQRATGIGSLTAATTYHFQVSALTGLGFGKGSQGRTGGVDAAGETTPTADVGIATAAASSPGDKSITFGWTSVKNAFAYNVYGSLAGGGSNVYLTTVYNNAVTIGSVAGSANTVNTADQTGDANAWLGIPGLIMGAGGVTSNAYTTTLAGSSLTSDGTSGIQELDAANLSIFQTYYAGVDIWSMGPATKKAVDQLVAGSTAPVFRISINDGAQDVVGAITAQGMLNRYTQRVQRFEVHPFLPPGIIIGRCSNLGPYYPLAGLPNPIEMMMGLDMIQFDFPSLGTYWPFGMYAIGAPCLRITFPHAVIRDVGPIASFG